MRDKSLHVLVQLISEFIEWEISIFFSVDILAIVLLIELIITMIIL
jgi:hypothetical protein